jgi:hypothetical protein
MIALAGRTDKYFKANETEELIKWVFQVQFEVHWGQRSTDTFLGSHST